MTRFLKIKNSILELEKDFIKLKDRGLEDRGVKIKWETEELFFKPITVSMDDMNEFEKNQ